jgi:predicted secreted Zn-dependent protease
MWNSQERHLACSRNRNVEQSRKTSSLFQEQKCGTAKTDIYSVPGTEMWNSQKRHVVCSRNRNVKQSRKTSSLFQEQKCETVKKDI